MISFLGILMFVQVHDVIKIELNMSHLPFL